MDQAVSFDGAGESQHFYNVSDFIDDLRSGKLSAPSLTAAKSYQVGYADGKNGLGIYKWDFAPFEAEYMQGYEAGRAANEPPAEFVAITELALPLTVAVYVPHLRTEGIISGRSTCDDQRWRVTFFNRHFWRVEHKWFARSQFEVIGAAENVAIASATLSA